MGKEKNRYHYLIPFILLVALGLVWGSSFILIKRGLTGFTPLQLVSIRVGLAGVIFLPLVFRRRAKQVPSGKIKPLLAVGLFGSTIPFFLFALAETRVDSGTTGVINSLMPLMTMSIGFLAFRISLGREKIIGILAGLAGVLLLLFQGNAGGIAINTYALFAVLATVGYGLSSNIVQKYLKDIPAIYITAFSFVMCGLPFFFLGFFIGIPQLLLNDPIARNAFYYIVILSVFGTVIANIFYFRLIQLTSAAYSSLVTYIIPVVALLIGFFDGEHITGFHMICMLLIFSGIMIASGKKK